VSAVVLGFLAQAQKDYAAAQAALHANPPNFTLYGQEIAKMKAALDSAQQAANPAKSGKSSGGSPSPSTSPSPPGKSSSPSPSPSPSS
jgi:multidrug resistance efflux pump